MEIQLNFKIAGVVILYHPDKNVCVNIETYLSFLDTLYVIDNTERPDEEIVDSVKKLSKVKYIAFYENKGMAYALNYALTKAASDNYNFLLTMDQDSSFTSEYLKQYIRRIHASEQQCNDIVSYAVNYGPLDKDKVENQIITYYITSGSVLNVSKTLELGGFDEKLFIDQVDSEFAYRVRLRKQKIVTFFDIYMNHHLGDTRWYHVGKYKFAVLNHGPIRKYYIFRNLIYVMKKYDFLKKAYCEYIVKELIKVLFFEKDKLKKLRYIFMAFQDARRGKYGKYTINR